METWLSAPWEVIWKTAASTALITCALIAFVRLNGLRSFAKMSSVGFASTVAIGSMLASVALSSDHSLLKGAVAIFVVLGLQQLMSHLKRAFPGVETVIENEPVFLMRSGRIIEKNLRATGVSRDDLMAKLREANVLRLAQVKAVVFETTGDVSVVHGEGEVDGEIYEGVQAI